jgi:hypothetical protein
MTVDAVDGNADDLGTQALEFLQLRLVEAELVAAGRAPVERIED